LNTLAQHEVISDDPTEADKDGKTQLWRVRERNKLDMMRIILAQFRVVALIFGTALLWNFLKPYYLRIWQKH